MVTVILSNVEPLHVDPFDTMARRLAGVRVANALFNVTRRGVFQAFTCVMLLAMAFAFRSSCRSYVASIFGSSSGTSPPWALADCCCLKTALKA